MHDADVDAGVGAAQALRVDSGALKRLPADLKQLPLLRIHRQRFLGGDAEEARVELGRVMQEGTFAHVRRAGRIRIGVVKAVEIPPAVVGEWGVDVGAVGHDPPELLGSADPAGEPAAQGHDGDRLRGGGDEQIVLLLKSGRFLDRLAKRSDEILFRCRQVRPPRSIESTASQAAFRRRSDRRRAPPVTLDATSANRHPSAW